VPNNKENKKDFIDSKNKIRRNIVSSSKIFKQNLTGKYVMYILDDNSYIEVFYRKSSFAHLTGVRTKLNAFDFYEKSISNKLTFNDFAFDSYSHPFDLAKKKTSRLEEITKFVTDDLIVIQDMNTETATYKFGLTDTDLTLCLVENLDKETKTKIDDYYIPASFRVGDNSVMRSTDGKFVEYIFAKTNKNILYNSMCYGDISNIQGLPSDLKDKLDFDRLYKTDNI
jgi:hypothetical protein